MDPIVKLGFIIAFSLFLLTCSQQHGEEDLYQAARRRMVKEDIQKRGIDDQRILQAMLKVKRHLFVPESYRPMAYADRPLPIGEGQTISQPYIVALMTYHLHLKPDDKVLEIGTGSGYQAAVLAELAKEVYSIEIIEQLARTAHERLQALGYTNVQVKSGDGFFGWPTHAPYDAVIITCATPTIPERLVEQLGEGGRMVLPLGAERFHQSLTVVTKRGGKIERRLITDVVFVPMTGEIGEGKK
ncbi:MAG: protein-L-isoaspartate O-methyltransferase [Deltaproteobacteria bacterium RBG_16_54_11]|jgi:protein-L-isoaspartate(D-aspartate) O-methyltransferase|nr:MAG: protein-L-isoaspartate O-methyltransferase [Deltaproteobacteria bacterium RBG_16_54_11]